MRARLTVFFLLLGVSIFISSCGDEAPPKSTIEFNQDQHDGGKLEVSESNGGVTSFHPLLYNNATGISYDIEIDLNRPVAETTVIRFSTSGTATRSSATEVGDYDIEADGDLLVIEKGESSATLTVKIFEDYEFEITSGTELYEMFTIQLEEVVAGTGKLSTENVAFDIFINEDDAIIQLNWDPLDDTGTDPGDVDMDLIVWMNGDQLTASASPGTDAEGINIPAGLPNAQYGFSYTYYSGSSNNLEFYVDIYNLGGTLNGGDGLDGKSYTKAYTQDNINKYDETGADLPFIAQTMNKSGFNYVSLIDVTVNSSGSRVQTGEITIPRGQSGRFPIGRINQGTLLQLKKATGL